MRERREVINFGRRTYAFVFVPDGENVRVAYRRVTAKPIDWDGMLRALARVALPQPQ